MSFVVLQPGCLTCTSTTRNFEKFRDGWCGEPAVIKCLSCVKFDPSGTGRYCLACFKAKHPAYRTHHYTIPIEKDENIGTWELQKQVHRYEKRRRCSRLPQAGHRLVGKRAAVWG